MMLNNSHAATELSPLQQTLTRLASMFGVVVVLIGVLVLIGWEFNIELFKRVVPGLVAMNPTTAMTFVHAGIALVLLQPSRAPLLRAWGKILAWLVMAIGLARLTGYVAGWEGNIDQLLFREKLNAEDPLMPNRMAPNTALCFVLQGTALVLADVRTRRSIFPAEFLALAVLILSLLAITGYAFGVRPFIGYAQFIPMALHTALCFLLLSLGLFFTYPNRGIMTTLTSPHVGGLTARKLLPMAILLPIALGWLRLQGERAGWYQTEFGTALFATLIMLVFSVVIWWNATSLNRADEERRQSIGALKAKTEELDRYFTSSLDLLCIADTDGYFRRLNPQWEKTLGYTLAELEGKRFLDFVHPDDLQATLAAVETLSDAKEVLNFVNRYRCKDGTYRWIEWRSYPIGNVIYAAARDISERKRIEDTLRDLNQRLEATNKELEAFSYSVSHDLRAPLRHIDGFADLLLKKAATHLDEQAKQYLATIAHSAKHMGQLIDDLLMFSRMGRAELRTSTVDMGMMVREVIQSLAHETKERNIRWIIHPLPLATADPSMIRLVWQNLLGNAIKYTRPRQQAIIEVGALEEGDVQTFFVRDNGVGFDMNYSHKLFGVFQRLHKAEEFEGTGIGLANVQRIVARHGGTTRAEGAVGKGAAFYFSLPVQQGRGVKSIEKPS